MTTSRMYYGGDAPGRRCIRSPPPERAIREPRHQVQPRLGRHRLVRLRRLHPAVPRHVCGLQRRRPGFLQSFALQATSARGQPEPTSGMGSFRPAAMALPVAVTRLSPGRRYVRRLRVVTRISLARLLTLALHQEGVPLQMFQNSLRTAPSVLRLAFLAGVCAVPDTTTIRSSRRPRGRSPCDPGACWREPPMWCQSPRACVV